MTVQSSYLILFSCLLLLSGCSLQKMRYSHGMNIHMELFSGKNFQKKPGTKHCRKPESPLTGTSINTDFTDDISIPALVITITPESSRKTTHFSDKKPFHKIVQTVRLHPIKQSLQTSGNNSGDKVNPYIQVAMATSILSFASLAAIAFTGLAIIIYITFALAILTFISSLVGLSEVAKGKGYGKDMGIFALIASILLYFICLIVFAFI